MTIFLIIMIPVSGFLGFMTCAILQIAAQADRQEESCLRLSCRKTLRKRRTIRRTMPDG